MALEQPLWLQQSVSDPVISYTGQQLRTMFDVMAFLSGVTLKNDLKVSQRAAGANLSVDVAAGSAIVPGTQVAYQGKYLVRSTATVNVPLVGGLPGTGSRTDLIVAQVYDDQADGSGAYSWTPLWVPGTTSAPPTSIPLATVTVSSGSASILAANISDVRLLNTQGDVPLWQRTGGNGQSLPNGPTVYSSGTLNETIGVDTNGNPGEMVCRQAGRYIVSATMRLSTGGTTATERQVYLETLRGGTVQRRVASQAMVPAASLVDGYAITATGTVRANAGDVVRAIVFQNTGATLTLSDKYSELSFTGVWVGP